MIIEKITVTETEWKNGIRFEKEKTYSRDEHRGDFNDFILEELPGYSVKDFAREQFELIEERDCPKTYIDDFHTEELIDELKLRGFDVVRCETISDSLRFEKLKQKMEFS